MNVKHQLFLIEVMESSTNLSNHDSADEHEDVERAGVAIHQDV